MDCIVHGTAKKRTWLSGFHPHFLSCSNKSLNLGLALYLGFNCFWDPCKRSCTPEQNLCFYVVLQAENPWSHPFPSCSYSQIILTLWGINRTGYIMWGLGAKWRLDSLPLSHLGSPKWQQYCIKPRLRPLRAQAPVCLHPGPQTRIQNHEAGALRTSPSSGNLHSPWFSFFLIHSSQ